MNVPGLEGAGPDTAGLLRVLADAVDAVATAVGAMDVADRRRQTGRGGQYRLDLVADEAVVGVLQAAGLRVVSEESGATPAPSPGARADLAAVVDPVDGSTNAAIGLPWYATSVCVLDAEGPLVALVANLASGTRFEAVRGGGARCDGVPIAPSDCRSLASAVVGVSGLPTAHPGWAQFRALGAASLDLCEVARGSLDGYRVAGGATLHPWDYLGALLVVREAGACIADLDGHELALADAFPRRPVAAATPALLADLAAATV